MQIMGGMF